jgi:hypothetical protein
MQSRSIKIYTYTASYKMKLLNALNTTSSASLMAGFKAFDNDIILWWGEMVPPLNRSPDLGNSFSRTESINV